MHGCNLLFKLLTVSTKRWHQYFELHSNCRHHQDRVLILPSLFSVDNWVITATISSVLLLFSFSLLIVIHSSMSFMQDWIIWTDWFLDWREDDSQNRYNWVSSAYRWNWTLCLRKISRRGAAYKTYSIGPRRDLTFPIFPHSKHSWHLPDFYSLETFKKIPKNSQRLLNRWFRPKYSLNEMLARFGRKEGGNVRKSWFLTTVPPLGKKF